MFVRRPILRQSPTWMRQFFDVTAADAAAAGDAACECAGTPAIGVSCFEEAA